MNTDVQHFLDESEALHGLIATCDAHDFARPTAFKDWTTDRILHHLHCWNIAACLSLADGTRFRAWYETTLPPRSAGRLDVFERVQCGGLTGPALACAWRDGFRQTATAFAAVDPKARVEWAALTMSARSSITARMMETWAHGQAIYDLAGRHRVDTDRIHGIAVLGVNTFGWTFKNRGQPTPGPQPYVALVGPSGAAWTFGDPTAADRVTGSATEFCQVVAQTRNIADTSLVVTGPVAQAWMAIAQCFAGPPEDPPKPGLRRMT
jgi:uncharacterized protein (TIGR03084 family)